MAQHQELANVKSREEAKTTGAFHFEEVSIPDLEKEKHFRGLLANFPCMATQ